jgi:hypothetical protein
MDGSEFVLLSVCVLVLELSYDTLLGENRSACIFSFMFDVWCISNCYGSIVTCTTQLFVVVRIVSENDSFPLLQYEYYRFGTLVVLAQLKFTTENAP